MFVEAILEKYCSLHCFISIMSMLYSDWLLRGRPL